MAPQSKSHAPPVPYGSDPNEEWSASYIAKGVMGCIAGLFIHLFLGALYSWGTINIYVTSYYKTLDSSVTLENNVIAFPLMMFSLGVTMRAGIYYAEVTHPLIAISSASLLLACSVFISSYMNQIWGFLFFYGILFGLLMGSLFMLPIVECNKYFPGKKMFVNGSIMGGGGFGAMIFGMFSYSYLNPEKLHPLEGYYMGTPELVEIAEKVPTLLRLIALLQLCIGIAAVLMITPVCLHNRRVENQRKAKQKAREEEIKKNQIAEGNTEAIQAIEQTAQQATDQALNQALEVLPAGEAATLKQAFCSKICVIEAFFVIFVGCGLYLMNGNYKTYVKKTISDDEFLTFIGVAGSVANGISRFIWNSIFLKTGYKFVMLCILSLEILVLSTVRLTIHTPGAYLVLIFIINFCLGGLLTTTTTVLQVIFGQRTGSNIAGFYWCCIATTNFIQYFYVSFLSKTIGFDNVIYICLAMSLVAVIICIFTTFQGPWMNDLSALRYFITCQKTQEKTAEQIQQLPSQQVILQNDINNPEYYDIVLNTSKISKRSHKLEEQQNNPQRMSPRDKRIRLEPIKSTTRSFEKIEENQVSLARTGIENSGQKLIGENEDSINEEV